MYSYIFYINLKLIPPIILIGISLTTCLSQCPPSKIWRGIRMFLSGVAILLIFKFTVFGRQPSSVHLAAFFAPYSNEFWREMIMNMMLYFPLGLILPYAIENYQISVLAAFILSLSIEAWQYIAGTGLAQGTDVIMNMLGTAIGGLSYAIARKIENYF